MNKKIVINATDELKEKIKKELEEAGIVPTSDEIDFRVMFRLMKYTNPDMSEEEAREIWNQSDTSIHLFVKNSPVQALDKKC